MTVRDESSLKQRLPFPGEPRYRPRLGFRRLTICFSVLGFALLALSVPNLSATLSDELTSSPSFLAALQLDVEIVSGLAIAGGYVGNALRTVEDERQSVAAEEEAFTELASGIQSLSTAKQTASGGGIARLANAGTSARQLEKIREQYRDSVMSVPDYDSQYGESFEEHFAAEFGHEVASVVLDCQQLNKPVKQLLVQQARESARDRQQLLDGLELEERSLHESKAHLEPIDSFLVDVKPNTLRAATVSELVDTDDEIRKWRAEVESLLRTRQCEIQTINRRVGSATETLLQDYLYQQQDATFPVLQSGLEYIRELEQRRSTLIRTLYQR